MTMVREGCSVPAISTIAASVHVHRPGWRGLFRSLPVWGVIAGSEAFPPGEQARFEQGFGIRVSHWYGHSEYAALAYCCRECRSFHFYLRTVTWSCFPPAPKAACVS